MKKKLLIAAGIVAGLIVVAMIVIPLLFKDQLLDLVKREANKNLNARLEFDDLSLSLFRDFPDLNLQLSGLEIINNPPFEGDTLVSLSNFSISLDVMAMLLHRQAEIVALSLDQPRIDLKVAEDGSANWEITAPSTAAPDTQAAAAQDFSVSLRNYEIRDGRLAYDDRLSGTRLLAAGLNHSGSGNFSRDRFELRTRTLIESLTAASGGIEYLKNVNTELRADVDVDAVNSKFTLLDNELRMNHLFLKFDGFVAQQGENLELDMRFNAPETEFKNIISLIPAIYANDFKELKTSGSISLEGKVKGVSSEERVPQIDIQLLVNDGMFQYPDLPAAIENTNVDLAIRNPGRTADDTVIDLKKLHFEIGDDPFDATLSVKSPVSDPDIAATANGKINLGRLKNAMRLSEETVLGGTITSNLQINSRLSSIEEGKYEKVKAAGIVAFEDINYQSPEVPEKVVVSSGRLAFTPANVRLSNLDCTLGKSDLQADGTLLNMISYLFSDQDLKGTLVIRSKFFDLNPWMDDESEGLSAFDLPDRIEFTLSSRFDEVLFGELSMRNVTGTLLLKDRTLHLIDLNMDMLNGSVLANGTYSTSPGNAPKSFFDLRINQIGIGEAFKSFVTVQKFAPIAKSTQGDFSASLQFDTELDQTLTPIMSSLSSRGNVKINEATILDFKPLTKLSDLTGVEKLKRLVVKDIQPSYKIQNGRFHLRPLSFSVDNIDLVLAGSNGLDRTLDYEIKLRLPAKDVNAKLNSAISGFLKKDLAVLQNEKIDISSFVKGTVDEPAVKISSASLAEGAAAQVSGLIASQVDQKKSAAQDSVALALKKQQEELEKAKKEAEEKAKAEAEKLKEEAKKKLKKLFNP